MLGLTTRQVFFILVLAAAIYAGTQIIPVFFRAYQFSDFVYSEVKFAASNRTSMEKLRTDITNEARNSEIPVSARDIRITRRGPTFTVQIEYELPVDLHFYRRMIPFHINDSGTIFENDPN